MPQNMIENGRLILKNIMPNSNYLKVKPMKALKTLLSSQIIAQEK